LENRGSKDDEVSRRVWQTVEASTRKVRIEEAKERGSKGRGWKKERRKEEEENKKGEDDGGKENSRGMGDMG